jgi:transposase
MARVRQKRYTPEFKAEAVRLFQDSDTPIATLARELGVATKSLRTWVQEARPQPAVPLTEDERSELLRLRRELQRVTTERDILKKATAFFARQSE